MLWLKIKYMLLVLVLMSIAGCQSFGQSTTQIDRDGIDIISTGTGTKITFIKKRGDTEILCAPREGDVATTYSSGGGLGFSVAGDNDTISDDDAKGALSLGGRNPEVLLARELMFRACELSSNMNADNKTSFKIYSLFLEKLLQLSKHESIRGTDSQYSGINNNTGSNFNNNVPAFNTNTQNSDNNEPQNNNSHNNSKNTKCDSDTDWNCDDDN